jgi:arginine deiminase
MALGVHSEGGKLRKVLICRLGLEHSASPPSARTSSYSTTCCGVTKAKEGNNAAA